jgi:hypothetical protein
MDRPVVLHEVDAPRRRIDLLKAPVEGADLLPSHQIVVEVIHLAGERGERPGERPDEALRAGGGAAGGWSAPLCAPGRRSPSA